MKKIGFQKGTFETDTETQVKIFPSGLTFFI